MFPSRTFTLLHNDDNMCMIIFHTNGGFYWCCRFFLLFPFEQFLYKSFILYSLKGSKTHTIKFRYQKTFGNCKSFHIRRKFSRFKTIAIMFLCSWNKVAYVSLYWSLIVMNLYVLHFLNLKNYAFLPQLISIFAFKQCFWSFASGN